MPRPRLIALILALCVLPVAAQPADPSAEGKPPLAGFLPIKTHLDQGLARFLKGEDSRTAYAPYHVFWAPAVAAHEARLRAQLKAAGAAKLEVVMLTLQFVFKKGETADFGLRTFVLFEDSGARLGPLSRSADPRVVFARPLTAFSHATLRPFADGTRQLLTLAREQPYDRAPVMTLAAYRRFGDPRWTAEQARAEREKAAVLDRQLWTELKARAGEPPHLEVRHQVRCSVQDAKGARIGWLQCKIKQEQGKAQFLATRYMPER